MQSLKTTSKYKYAGFWIRLLAVIIDWIILGVIGYVLFGTEVTSINGSSLKISYRGWKSIVPILYAIIFWIWQSATPGKLLLGIKIINKKGQNLSWKQSVLRCFSYLASIFMVGFIWIGFDPKKQGWHDKIANTFVIRTN